jgi:hypothetical protein
VRTATSGWTYDHMALVVHSSEGSEKDYSDSRSEIDNGMVNVVEKKITPPLLFKINTSNRQCDSFLPNEDAPLVVSDTDRKKITDKYRVDWNLATRSLSVKLQSSVTSGGVAWCLCRDGPDADYTEFDVKTVTVIGMSSLYYKEPYQ